MCFTFRPSSTTDAAVSSQEDSIANILLIQKPQRCFSSVPADLCIGEDLLGQFQMFGRVHDRRTVVCQPKFFYFRFLRNARRFHIRHMLFLFRAFLLFRITIHAFTDEQVSVSGAFYDGIFRTGIRTVAEDQALSGAAQDHIRRIGPVAIGDGLALLQVLPIKPD